MTDSKVLLLADNLNNGGAERQLMLLVKNIPDAWGIFLWSIEGGLFLSELDNTNIQHKISPRKFRFDITPLFDLVKITKEYQPDIIHSWGWMSTVAGIIVSKIFNIPLVNGIIRSGTPYYYRGNISKLLSNWGDVVVANSKAGLKNWGVAPSRGMVIYNGFDHNRLAALDQAMSPSPGNDEYFRVVMTARMVKAKDFSLFISAARKIVQQGVTSWKFLAIGYGEDKNSLVKENTDLIQLGILEFPEADLEVIPFLQKSNVGILLTKSKFHEEGCSNTIMEYMACGLPVIATNSGGNRELIENEVTGFIIPNNDEDELIDKLIWIYEHPIEASEMGEKAKNKLLKEFSIQKMVRETVNLYGILIDRAKGNQ